MQPVSELRSGLAIMPLVLLIIPLLIVLILLFRKGGRTTRRLIIIVPVVLLSVVVLTFFMRLAFHKRFVIKHIGTMPHPSVAYIESNNITPPIWKDDIAKQFQVDNYPSIRSAARGLTDKVSDALPGILPQQQEPMEVKVLGNVERTILDQVARLLQDHFSSTDIKVKVVENDRLSSFVDRIDKKESIAMVKVNITAVGSFSIGGPVPFSAKHSTLQITATAPGGQITESIGFLDKPWVDNFADYINRNPKGHWLLALSQGPGATEQEAQRQAMTNACGQVARLLQERGQLNRSVFPGDIHQGGFIEDRFVQKLQGLSGPIWREAMLINGAPEKLEKLARKITNATAQQRQSKRTMILSLLGMLAVISGVYLFLNAATRGYYTWSIRIMLIILAGAGVFLVLTIS
jgi:hypothetical protein